ncbi:brachyurin-like [Phlebotomus argentipes]|uniref:brachyurin-like n=1 Tax=Phlebotomus argentipes TaxID=94469 RepID=UPI0028929894|nr:brachyurin-like [Phlebotomus argentipes]
MTRFRTKVSIKEAFVEETSVKFSAVKMLQKIAKIFILFHLLDILHLHASPTNQAANQPEEFIIGGENAANEFTNVCLIVSLLETSTDHGYLFSGVLISPSHVLTAGQAAHGYHRWKVGLGHVNRLLMHFYVSQNATVHPNFNPVNLNNNLAIIQLTESVAANIATPIVMAPVDLMPAMQYIYFGYGSTNPTTPDAVPYVLQQAFTTLLPVNQCQIVYGNQLVTEASWCAQGSLTTSLCFGDQGGPLLHFLDRFLVGIASFWMPPCNSGHPNVFVRVSHYRDWINQEIQSAADP